MSKNNEKDIFEKMGTTVPGAFTTLGIGFAIFILISIVFLILFYLIVFFGSFFDISLSPLTYKFAVVLIICLIFSALPMAGIFFAINFLIIKVPELILTTSIEMNIWIWIIYIISFIFAIGIYLFNTISQFYVIFIVDYPTPKLKRKNQILSILILIISSLIGLIIGINFNNIVLFISNLIFGL